MSPVHILRRHLKWEGPRTRTPKGIDPAFIQKQPRDKVPQWKALSEQLGRQSYVLTLIYDVDRDQFGQTSTQSEETNGASQYVVAFYTFSTRQSLQQGSEPVSGISKFPGPGTALSS